MDTLHLTGTKPKMIAHRGLSGIEMENTASAFVAAGNRSYYGIETDVHRTADGEFIIIHDDDTKRVALDHLVVEETTYETLRSLRLIDRNWKRGRKDLILPSLQEYIQICKKYEKVSVLELKNHMETEDLVKIIQIINDEGWLENTVFISFDLPNMIRMRQLLPKQELQFLVADYPDWLEETLLKYDLDIDIFSGSLTEERVKRLHDLGIEINVWTVDKLEEAERLARWGVDYITSDIVE